MEPLLRYCSGRDRGGMDRLNGDLAPSAHGGLAFYLPATTRLVTFAPVTAMSDQLLPTSTRGRALQYESESRTAVAA
jgi:hypothetical protein